MPARTDTRSPFAYMCECYGVVKREFDQLLPDLGALQTARHSSAN